MAHDITPESAHRWYEWHESQLTKGFSTWAEEIRYMESLGYQLVPPDYHIPHWSQAEGAREIYTNGVFGPRKISGCFDRPARDFSYPIFFRRDRTRQ